MIGAIYAGNGQCRFVVWAPEHSSMQVHIVHPCNRYLPMTKDQQGYFTANDAEVLPGYRYYYTLPDGRDLPDPASRSQPLGVHGPSEVTDPGAYRWTDQEWKGLPLSGLVIYELHVGCFTEQGSFEAIIPRLQELYDLGVNAIELMPVAQFPGTRNWGYDGVYPYAPQHSYGGAAGLKKLVDACHHTGIVVILDVVYNHLGPEGNYVAQFGPYFSDTYHTPWGEAFNFDGQWSDGVREYFCGNMAYWLQEFHIDGLRLDAIHTIFDNGAVHFWELAHSRVLRLQQRLGRSLYLIAESDLNMPRVVAAPASGGYGFSAQWLDDFHHALYILLHPEEKHRYIDFGAVEQLAKAYKEGFVHSGAYVQFRKRRYGASSAGINGEHFVAFMQNHDQVGNRADGKRLSMLVSFEKAKLAAACVLLAPYIPLLFMGEEFAADTPFHYFTSHSDKDLIEAIKKGRYEEFNQEQTTAYYDPQDKESFIASKLQWQQREQAQHAAMLGWYRRLLQLRKTHPALQSFDKDDVQTRVCPGQVLQLYRRSALGDSGIVACFNLGERTASLTLPGGADCWRLLLDSSCPVPASANTGELPAYTAKIFECIDKAGGYIQYPM